MFLAGTAMAEKIIIGHFGNPTPMQLLASSDAVQKATGWDVEWRKFAAGTDVIAAMASGDVVLSELGSSPLAIAASQGVDLQLISFSDVIGKAESLIVTNAFRDFFAGRPQGEACGGSRGLHGAFLADGRAAA